MKNQRNHYVSIPVFIAFMCMGFGDMVGPLTGLIKNEFQLSNLAAQMIPFMGFLMFGLLSIPIGVFQDKTGRKRVLLIGLTLAFIGLGIPFIARFAAFSGLLFGILLLGAGAAFLQVSGNPLMRDVSPPGKYARNLSLAQFIKATGSLSGVLLPLLAANYWGADWKILFPVYMGIILLTIIWIGAVKVPSGQSEKKAAATFSSSFALLRNPFVLLMVTGIFLYVGAEVSLSSGLPILLEDKFGLDIARLGLLGTLFFFIALMSGRFIGAIVLNWISARTFLKITSLISLAGFAMIFSGVQTLAMIGAFTAGLGFANIFPLIFSITVESMPERSNELSGLMVTAIVGGAIIPPVMGLVADLSSVMTGFMVPLLCILFISLLSFLKASPRSSNRNV